jgi:hypothetical protein
VPGWPRFALFGWVSPPVDSTREERIAEMAALGLDVLLPAWADSGRLADNRVRMDLAAAHGMRALVWDRRFYRVAWGTAEGEALVDSIVADYRDHPGFLGYYFGDEPADSEFTFLDTVFTTLRAADPAHPAWNNLFGRGAFATRERWLDHTRAYHDATRAPSLSNDHYDLLATGDRGMFVENLAGLSAIARERGVPFWSIIQLVQHGPFRALTTGELRWQASHALAYGARGIGYFTYWTPAPDPVWNWQPAVIGWDGTRTAWYDVLAEWNPRVRAAGETLADLVWVATEHAGSVPGGATSFAPDAWVSAVEGRAAIGSFSGPAGERHLLIASSDSSATQTLSLHLPGATAVERLGDAVATWTPIASREDPGGRVVDLVLGPGEFALLRIAGDPAGPFAGGSAPRVAAAPNPARGEVRFTLSRLGTGARVEVLDLQGRRVWSADLPAGRVERSWRGERSDGGFAAPGTYIVRVEDREGVAADRFVWLRGP